MAKAILICGKICSGKTHYAGELCRKHNAVILSSDELISALFHPRENDYHDQIIKGVHAYLMKKSMEILRAGTNVILDWGFWTAADRAHASACYRQQGIEVEWHYLHVSDDAWKRNIRKRNDDVVNRRTTDYYVDQGLLDKLERLFEAPERDEMDIWINE